MCGILGNFNKSSIINQIDLDNFFKFGECLKCRGPDNFGYFCDKSKKNYLSHYRLSIIDLSSNSNQPIISEDERYVVSFNGEIYNFKELSSKINKFKNKNINSDTRVLTEYIATYGIEKTCTDINGMFSIAVFDQKKTICILLGIFLEKNLCIIHFRTKIFSFPLL